MKNKRILIDLIIIAIIGLIPLLWFPGNSLILGHDAGLPFDPVAHFLDRFYVWSQRFGIGTDQSSALLGAFFIHGIEATLTWIGFSIQMQQKIQFIFWFVLPGFFMYIFAHSLWREKKYLPLIASIIYMLNFFLVQGWFVAERTKFSIYIALPLVMYFLLRFFTKKIGLLHAIIGTGLVLGIFNGGGSFPLYGGLAFAMLITFVYVNLIESNVKTFLKTIFYTIGVGIIYFLLNAYWLIPYIFYISGFYNRDLANAGGPEGALTWAKYLSSQSTFMNVLRGQGIPEWYLNPYHAFAEQFLHNPLLIIISFLFPILAFGALLCVKTKRDKFYIYLFVLIALVAILFSSGPQSQLGIIYEAMVRYVPGFAMFRSAFYKFNYTVWFTYGILIGFTLDYLFSLIEKKWFQRHAFLFVNIVLSLFAFGYVFYHYPVLTGSFFDYSHEPQKELTTRVTVPQYVFDFGKWMNQQNPNKRYLIMPQLGDTNYISYQWHYWSIAPITSLLTRHSFVHNTALVPQNERLLIEQMYAAFLRGDMESFKDFADVFAIDGIVLQKDFDWKNISWGTIDPKRYETILKREKLFKLEKTFGEWQVYDLIDRDSSLRINATAKLDYLNGELSKIVSFPYFDPKSPLFLGDKESANQDFYVNHATKIFLAPECSACNMDYPDPSLKTFKFYNPKILPNSFLYPFVLKKEQKVKAQANTFMSLLNYYIATANRRIIEAKWMTDSNKGMNKLLVTLDAYHQTLLEMKTLLQREEWDTNGKQENIAAQLVLYNIMEEVGIIDSLYTNESLTLQHRDLLAQAYNTILELEKLANKKLWVTQDLREKKYIFDMPLTGDYEVYVKKSSLTDPTKDTTKTTVTLKGDSKEYLSTEEVGDWLSFGTLPLNNKKLFLSLHDATVSNLIENKTPVFPNGEKGIFFEDNKFNFSVDSINKCFYYPVDGLEANAEYVVSFSYRNFSEQYKLGFLWLHNNEIFYPYSVKNNYIVNSSAWKTYTKVLSTKEQSLNVYFCNSFLSLSELGKVKEEKEYSSYLKNQPVIELQDIAVQKISYPNVLLYKKQKEAQTKDIVKNFAKESPIHYTVNLTGSKDPTSIIMRESYGKYWKVCDETNTCLPFDDKSHFASAGFANAWYFPNGVSKKLTFYYYPQKMFIIGSIITLITVILIIGGICLHIRRKK